MSKLLSKLAVVAAIALMVFVSHSLGSKQSDSSVNNQLKVDVLTLPKVPGNNPDIPRVVRDYSELTPPAREVLFALVSFSDGSTLVVPQGLHASEVKEAATNIFVLKDTTLTLTGNININSVVAVYK
jgi:hypothetical protein